MSEGRRAAAIEAVLVTLGMAGVAATIVYGATSKLSRGQKTTPGAWGGDSFATLAWIGLILLVVATVRAVRQGYRSNWGLLGVGVGGQILFGAGVAAVSLAWAAERQNYWDAYHFAVLAWNAILGSAAALVCVVLAARRGSKIAQLLIGPATFCVLAILLVWTWTWSGTVQELEASITRSLYLATHR